MITMLESVERWILYIMIYSFVGWVYETIICSLEAKRLVNRGFFNGPYCPIYGFGALIDVAIIGRIESVPLLFLLGALLDCTLEYITSYVMEKMFHARWWDYSTYRFNLNGRICLLGAVVFGAFSALTIKVIHPAVVYAVGFVGQPALHITSGVLLALFAVDAVVTITGMSGFNEKLHELTLELESTAAKLGEAIHSESSRLIGENVKRVTDVIRSSPVYESFSAVFEDFAAKLNAQQNRMIRSFPRLRSVHYDKTLSGLRGFILNRRKHKNDVHGGETPEGKESVGAEEEKK